MSGTHQFEHFESVELFVVLSNNRSKLYLFDVSFWYLYFLNGRGFPKFTIIVGITFDL